MKHKPFHPLARKHLASLMSPSNIVDRPLLAKMPSHLTPLFLDTNENAFLADYNRYPSTDDRELREAYLTYLRNELSERKKENTEEKLSIDNIFFTRGSTEGIDLILKAFGEPFLDTVAVTDPAFPLYAILSHIYCLKVQAIALQGDDHNQLNMEAFTQSDAKIIFLTNPTTPFGGKLEKNQIKAIVENAKGIVVVDEAYIEFSSQASCVDWILQYPNLIILRTFSKAFGLAGLRVGALIASPEIIAVIRQLCLAFVLTTPAIDALQKIFKEMETLKKSWKNLCKAREDLSRALKALSSVKKVYESEANFLFVQFHEREKVLLQLAEQGILVRASADFSDGVRITVGTPSENQQLLNALS